MAEQQFALIVPEVHATSFAVAPVFAAFAIVRFHPFVIAMRLETMLPDIHEVVFVDASLPIIRPDARASTDASIDQDGSHRDACHAAEHPVANVPFVRPEEAFAAVGSVNPTLFACLANEVEQSLELFSRQLQVFVLSPSANREDGGEPPIRDAFADEEFFELWQGVVVVLMNAGHHIVDE